VTDFLGTPCTVGVKVVTVTGVLNLNSMIYHFIRKWFWAWTVCKHVKISYSAYNKFFMYHKNLHNTQDHAKIWRSVIAPHILSTCFSYNICLHLICHYIGPQIKYIFLKSTWWLQGHKCIKQKYTNIFQYLYNLNIFFSF